MSRIQLLRRLSRLFWGLQLNLVATPHSLPIRYTLTGAKARNVRSYSICCTTDITLVGSRPGQILIGDKN